MTLVIRLCVTIIYATISLFAIALVLKFYPNIWTSLTRTCLFVRLACALALSISIKSKLKLYIWLFYLNMVRPFLYLSILPNRPSLHNDLRIRLFKEKFISKKGKTMLHLQQQKIHERTNVFQRFLPCMCVMMVKEE